MNKPLCCLLAIILPSGAAVAACPSNRVVTTVEGHYAALDTAAFSDMVGALRRSDTNRIGRLVEEGRLVNLPGGAPACLLNRPFHGSRFQIRLEGADQPYWVLRYAVHMER